MVWLLSWWAALLFFGQAFAPFLTKIFSQAPDRGFALAKPIALVAVASTAWLLGSLGTEPGRALGLAVAGFAALGAAAYFRFGHPLDRREVARQELAFLGAFLFFAAIRALSPAIHGAEKYMDFAFFNALVRAEAFPPEDPWLAGAPINYYYFGYLLFADLARLTRVPPELAYNLSLATIGAILFTGAVSIVRATTGSLRLGLLGGAAVALLGNLDAFLQLFVDGLGLERFDYWRSSRVVPNTINEFPFFSIFHGDLHPHVSALVIDVTVIAVAAAAWRDRHSASLREGLLQPARLALLTLLFGALALANPWDLPLFLGFTGLLILQGLSQRGSLPRAIGLSTAVVAGIAAGAMLLAYPFNRHFDAPLQGIGWVHTRTNLRPFVTVFGLLLAPVVAVLVLRAREALPARDDLRDFTVAAFGFGAVVLYVATGTWVWMLTAAIALGAAAPLFFGRDDSTANLAYALVVAGAVATFACEVVYLRDAYGSELHRMNTVFKLYFQAWLFLALAFPFFARQLVHTFPAGSSARTAAIVVLAAGVGAAACYPAAVIATRWKGPGALTLDGWAYLERDRPGDLAAIRWLRDRVDGRAVVLETTGNPYSDYARISSNTGLPTVLGWANHEGVWRGSDPRIGERREAVAEIYETGDLDRALDLLRRYEVRYVVVGELERRDYGTDGLEKFAAHPDRFEIAFRSGETVVYEVP